MDAEIAQRRHFLFVQGPHGPFVRQFAGALRAAGCRTTRLSLNGGDAAEWRDPDTQICFGAGIRGFADFITDVLMGRGITDVILYGDSRAYHKMTAAAAGSLGITVHFLEEGYLRPHWITYERGGVNGASPMLQIGSSDIASVDATTPLQAAPDQWGAMWGHLWHGVIYHARVWRGRKRWPRYAAHRPATASQDLRHAMRALTTHPFRLIRRRARERALMRANAPYHLVLLQLGHDASIQNHSHYDDMRAFMSDVAKAFAQGAPEGDHLVFKAHPFEDGRDRLEAWMHTLAARHDLAGRVHFLEGERLATLLDNARSAVTVNSTAAQQALWRNLPLRAFGRSVYDRPGLVSHQPLTQFFADPQRPDHTAYLAFRRAMLMTSQVPGGFYTRSGRRSLLRLLPAMMMREADPYSVIRGGAERGAKVTDGNVLSLSARRK
ncbi:capsular polysaccharide export protein, LipB/KpsS family [Pontivivens insulae]|nr:capsule biosynthesis protein CapA [Pontivivens insulae]